MFPNILYFYALDALVTALSYLPTNYKLCAGKVTYVLICLVYSHPYLFTVILNLHLGTVSVIDYEFGQ